jgi:hypothetical protein
MEYQYGICSFNQVMPHERCNCTGQSLQVIKSRCASKVRGDRREEKAVYLAQSMSIHLM